jgi:CRP/FNR family transcriptional regulator, cyclic AMP receptor protein
VAIAAGTSPVALVLEVDPDLGRNIDPAEWELARHACRGELLLVPQGPWQAASESPAGGDVVAFVIVDGLLARELSLRDRAMVELLGHGEVLQPPVVTGSARLGTDTRLTVVSDLRLLVLRHPFIRAAARWPTLLTELQRRLELQRESLAIQGLIAHMPTADQRLLLMLRHLADRWGYVTPDGIVLPWPLNHEILGRLIAVRRPTVTIALSRLDASHAVHRRDDGSWLLTATAERMINALARAPTVSHSVGERLMPYQQLSQTTAQNRALRAEARQLLSQRPTRTKTNT